MGATHFLVPPFSRIRPAPVFCRILSTGRNVTFGPELGVPAVSAAANRSKIRTLFFKPGVPRMGLPGIARRARLCLVSSLIAAPLGGPVAALTTGDNAAKVESFMRADSYNFVPTKSPTVWMIPFTGDHLKDIRVVVTVKDATMVVFVTVAQNQHLPVTTDFMRTLLEQNHELDRVKVGYDREGDLSVRIDGSMRVMDAAELREIVNQVRNASDEIYGIIEPSLL